MARLAEAVARALLVAVLIGGYIVLLRAGDMFLFKGAGLIAVFVVSIALSFYADTRERE